MGHGRAAVQGRKFPRRRRNAHIQGRRVDPEQPGRLYHYTETHRCGRETVCLLQYARTSGNWTEHLDSNGSRVHPPCVGRAPKIYVETHNAWYTWLRVNGASARYGPALDLLFNNVVNNLSQAMEAVMVMTGLHTSKTKKKNLPTQGQRPTQRRQWWSHSLSQHFGARLPAGSRWGEAE